MYSAVVTHPSVVLANQSLNPHGSHQKRPVAVKMSSKLHALHARRCVNPAFGAAKNLEDGLSRAMFSLHAQAQAQAQEQAPALAQTYGTVISEMPVNVFGEVVDNVTLAEFGMPPTQENRAKLAMRFINMDDKRGQATGFVDNLKRAYGNGVSTLCLVYNATGDPLSFAANQDWYDSSLFRHGYPAVIGNGQWAAFLHVKKPGAPSGSLGAVVYRGKNRREEDRDFLFAWNNPWSGIYSNMVYSQIGVVSFFDGRWDEIYNALINSNQISTSTADGVQIQAQIEGGTSPYFTAIISQQ